MIVQQGLSGTYFSSGLPDIRISTSSTRVYTTISVDDDIVYKEYLYAVGGAIRLSELRELIEPYALSNLSINVKISLTEQTLTNGVAVNGDTSDMEATVIYCTADVGTTAADYTANHFLSLLQGPKITAVGRLEYLTMILTGNDVVNAVAIYSDGTSAQFADIKATSGNNLFATYDVSPSLFTAAGKELAEFTITAGGRIQRYIIDEDAPDCAPILLFTNSFGVQELIYCTGTHEVAPEYKRSSAMFEGKLKNYDIEESRIFKADTGILNFPMANWLDDLFRSPEIYIVNIYNGTANVGREVAVTDSKSSYTNNNEELPRFTFSYRYAQRNQNVMQLQRAGRIFDNTFDNTFE